MAKRLKLWNGRMSPPYSHGYVAAYSRADAIRVITEAVGWAPSGMVAELRDYWSEGSWGDSMIGIKPERGLWVAKGFDRNIVRLIDRKEIPVTRGPEWAAFQDKERMEREAAEAERERLYQEQRARMNKLGIFLIAADLRVGLPTTNIINFEFKGHQYRVSEVEDND